MRRRLAILLLALAVLLALAAVWSYGYMASRCARAVGANTEFGDCLRMADQIEHIRTRPALATEHERTSTQSISAIERAAKVVGIDAKKLIRISPVSPQRIGDTAYKEKPTRILLKNVTLKQVVGMLHGMAVSPQRLDPRSVRIAAPRRNDTGSTWTVEIVVTYLIYEPVRPERTRSFR